MHSLRHVCPRERRCAQSSRGKIRGVARNNGVWCRTTGAQSYISMASSKGVRTPFSLRRVRCGRGLKPFFHNERCGRSMGVDDYRPVVSFFHWIPQWEKANKKSPPSGDFLFLLYFNRLSILRHHRTDAILIPNPMRQFRCRMFFSVNTIHAFWRRGSAPDP